MYNIHYYQFLLLFVNIANVDNYRRTRLNRLYTFNVRKSVHHHTIQISQLTRCNTVTSLLLHVYVWLNMFRAPLRPSSGAYKCTRSLCFYRWSVAVGALLVVVRQVIICQTTTNNAPTATLQGRQKSECPSPVLIKSVY